ncbi:IclR family transcriptional regulator domain-containing protein [Streptomyces eurocidicus]|uniref:DNA-binding IclR family transcriptional regulator n=1 Tax=Streptomyces eurocidicus TaxID=66423 RepID=A0A7W8BKL3_STREU|nr:IclR family transcriptional regulator C-terminal domain-containing protein [Streptomyces eurocidicus]MBB5123209.1 DNA-binding IclR family transcriptional regulator [Streptomyces eurocidicus]MBF6055488.1 hypothetical protein [Streptomyces eurocidicus]
MSTSSKSADQNQNKGPGSSHRIAYRVEAAFLGLSGYRHTPTTLAQVAGVSVSTAHRALKEGCEVGTYDTDKSGEYWLGGASAMWSMSSSSRLPAPAPTQAALVELHRITGGAAFYYENKGLAAVPRHRVRGDTDVSSLDGFALAAVGNDLRIGATGRAILAHASPGIQRQALARPLPHDAAPGAIRSEDELLACLEGIRARGHEVGQEECIPGWDAVAAPVLYGMTVQGAVLLLVPAGHVARRVGHLAVATMQAAESINTFF